jgi:hypothetical protein
MRVRCQLTSHHAFSLTGCMAYMGLSYSAHYTCRNSLPLQNPDGSYGQVAYAAHFPKEIGAIVAEFDNWIMGRDVPERTGCTGPVPVALKCGHGGALELPEWLRSSVLYLRCYKNVRSPHSPSNACSAH